jgi:hypothetical protein
VFVFLLVTMYDLTLIKVDDCVTHGDRAAAMHVLRAAVSQGAMSARDAIELMLAVRADSDDGVKAAIGVIRSGLPGAYRFVPKAEYAFA